MDVTLSFPSINSIVCTAIYLYFPYQPKQFMIFLNRSYILVRFLNFIIIIIISSSSSRKSRSSSSSRIMYVYVCTGVHRSEENI